MKSLFLPLFFISLTLFVFSQKTEKDFIRYLLTIPNSSYHYSMVPIPAGDFLMGSKLSDKNSLADESPQKKISISAFWMGATEVTRDQFDVFLKDESVSQNIITDAITRPSPQYVDLTWGMGKEVGFPANSMSAMAALMYCKWLYQKTGIFYRLPTEAEWEYACRAGTQTMYFFGNDANALNKYAWYQNNAQEVYHKVAQKLPNAWGLYDMLGNLMEWTLDHYDPKAYSVAALQNPLPPANKMKYPKVLRGGGFLSSQSELRVAKRFHSDPSWNKRDPQIPKSKWWLTEAKWVGFRILRPLNPPSPKEMETFYKNYLGF